MLYNVSLRGTPSDMQALRQQVQTAMSTIKDRRIDIAHASHHVDYLKQATISGKLPGGMKAEPKMMLWTQERRPPESGKSRRRRTRWVTWKWPDDTTKESLLKVLPVLSKFKTKLLNS